MLIHFIILNKGYPIYDDYDGTHEKTKGDRSKQREGGRRVLTIFHGTIGNGVNTLQFVMVPMRGKIELVFLRILESIL
jgi:hypothetical protein